MSKDKDHSSSELKQPYTSENTPCLADCGFFGAPCFKGYCSKCFTQLEIAKLTSETAGAQMEDSVPANERSDATTNAISENAIPLTKNLSTQPEDATTCTEDNSDLRVQQTENQERETNKVLEKINDNNTVCDKSTPVEKMEVEVNTSMPQVKEQKNKKLCATCNKKLKITDVECRCGLRLCSDHRYTDRHECTFDYKEQQRRKLEAIVTKVARKNLDNF